MKTAVVFAAYIDNSSYIGMFETTLKLFQSEMKESKFYVGINPCKYEMDIISYFQKYKLDHRLAITDTKLVLPTDASAYQTALSLMRDENEEYDLVWFIHTKGSTSHQYNDLTAQLIELILKKENVQKHFLENPKCGLYATSGVVVPKVQPFPPKYLTFRFPPLSLSPIYSCYVIKGILIKNFLSQCNNQFFCEKLPSGYFFEFSFPQICFQQGYVPFVQQTVQVHHGNLQTIKTTPKTYKSVLQKWMHKNRISLD